MRAVTIVRPDDNDVRFGKLARDGDEMLDPFAGGDSPDVEDDASFVSEVQP